MPGFPAKIRKLPAFNWMTFMHSRRDLLKQGFALAAAAGIPGATQRAYAITPDPGTTFRDAEHVVILMQENRSFDHMFGTLQGVRGFKDPRALRQPDGSSAFLQRDRGGNGYLPWRLNMRDSRITWMGSLPHGRGDQVDAWNGGLHNNWVEAKRSGRKEFTNIPMTMGYYTRDDLPFYYGLADAFTICDQNYCSIMTSTTPNRLMLWSGTVREQVDGGSRVHLHNGLNRGGNLGWTSYPERLQAAGLSWKVYQNQIRCEGGLTGEHYDLLGNYGDNSLEFFPAFPIHASADYRKTATDAIDGLQAELRKREAQFRQQLGDLSPSSPEATALNAQLKAYAAQHALLEHRRTFGNVDLDKLTPEQKLLRHRGLATNSGDPDFMSLETLSMEMDGETRTMLVPKGDILHQFRKDVRAGDLPLVSWLVPPGAFSDHPSYPWYGAWYVSEVMNILTENPEVWKKTIFILTYDENDGYFDHVPSYVAADPANPLTGGASAGIDTGAEYADIQDDLIQGIAETHARSGPIGLGYRVPMIIASPWSRGGWVNSELCDHTSIIRFLETFIDAKYGKKVVETNISSWRRTVCGDLTSNFRRYDSKPVKLSFLNRDGHLKDIQSAKQKPLPSDYRILKGADLSQAIAAPDAVRDMLFQEPGTRPSCGLPYELYADGEVEEHSGSFRLHLQAGNNLFGEGSSGAPFNIYLHGTKQGSQRFEIEGQPQRVAAATYAVRAGDEIKTDIELSRFISGNYDIAIHGPNGFYRNFKGGTSDPDIEIRCRYQRRSGGLTIFLTNRSNAACDIAVRHLSYGEPLQSVNLEPHSKRRIVLDLRDSHQWYDFEISVAGHPGFLKHYAGRVETGAPGLTDPAMGRAA